MYKNLLFSKRLKELRKESGVTQSVLAKKLEVSCLTYSNYEHGKSVPAVDTILKLCDILHVSADYLLGRTDTRYQKYEEAQTLTGLSELSINALKTLRDSESSMLTILDLLLETDVGIFGNSFLQHRPAGTRDNALATSEYKYLHPSVRTSFLLTGIWRYVFFGGDYHVFQSGKELPLPEINHIDIEATGFSVSFPSKEASTLCEYALEQRVINSLREFKELYWKRIYRQREQGKQK